MSKDWTVEQVMLCLGNMGISVSLDLRGVHRYKQGGKLDWRDQQFIDDHYGQICDFLLKKELAGREKKPRKIILQDWVTELGLRHQGVLLAAIRGCDTAPKEDPSKKFVRAYRSFILNAHCGDAAKASSFIEAVSENELCDRFETLSRNLDHYPHHYVMHLVHAVEIVGHKHPDNAVQTLWKFMYCDLCARLHVNCETEAQLDFRLNADEESFAARDVFKKEIHE